MVFIEEMVLLDNIAKKTLFFHKLYKFKELNQFKMLLIHIFKLKAK